MRLDAFDRYLVRRFNQTDHLEFLEDVGVANGICIGMSIDYVRRCLHSAKPFARDGSAYGGNKAPLTPRRLMKMVDAQLLQIREQLRLFFNDVLETQRLLFDIDHRDLPDIEAFELPTFASPELYRRKVVALYADRLDKVGLTLPSQCSDIVVGAQRALNGRSLWFTRDFKRQWTATAGLAGRSTLPDAPSMPTRRRDFAAIDIEDGPAWISPKPTGDVTGADAWSHLEPRLRFVGPGDGAIISLLCSDVEGGHAVAFYRWGRYARNSLMEPNRGEYVVAESSFGGLFTALWQERWRKLYRGYRVSRCFLR